MPPSAPSGFQLCALLLLEQPALPRPKPSGPGRQRSGWAVAGACARLLRGKRRAPPLAPLMAPPLAAHQRGWTALLYAARWGQLETARVLLVAGADVLVEANDGKTALQLAQARPRGDAFPLGAMCACM